MLCVVRRAFCVALNCLLVVACYWMFVDIRCSQFVVRCIVFVEWRFVACGVCGSLFIAIMYLLCLFDLCCS